MGVALAIGQRRLAAAADVAENGDPAPVDRETWA
jgi:hypothetical protein